MKRQERTEHFYHTEGEQKSNQWDEYGLGKEQSEQLSVTASCRFAYAELMWAVQVTACQELEEVEQTGQ